MSFNLKEAVRPGKKVFFSHFRLRDGQGELWYKTECSFEFPVPTTDVGDAIFKAEDNAMYFMRWMRQHQKLIQSAQTEQIPAI